MQFGAVDNEHDELIFHAAILGMNIESRVDAGENSGETLYHDFVALGVVSVPLNKTATIARSFGCKLISGSRALAR